MVDLLPPASNSLFECTPGNLNLPTSLSTCIYIQDDLQGHPTIWVCLDYLTLPI